MTGGRVLLRAHEREFEALTQAVIQALESALEERRLHQAIKLHLLVFAIAAVVIVLGVFGTWAEFIAKLDVTNTAFVQAGLDGMLMVIEEAFAVRR